MSKADKCKYTNTNTDMNITTSTNKKNMNKTASIAGRPWRRQVCAALVQDMSSISPPFNF